MLSISYLSIFRSSLGKKASRGDGAFKTPSKAEIRREMRRQAKEERWCKPDYRCLPESSSPLDENIILNVATWNALQTEVAAHRRAIVEQRRAQRGFGTLVYGYKEKSSRWF